MRHLISLDGLAVGQIIAQFGLKNLLKSIKNQMYAQYVKILNVFRNKVIIRQRHLKFVIITTISICKIILI